MIEAFICPAGLLTQSVHPTESAQVVIRDLGHNMAIAPFLNNTSSGTPHIDSASAILDWGIPDKTEACDHESHLTTSFSADKETSTLLVNFTSAVQGASVPSISSSPSVVIVNMPSIE